MKFFSEILNEAKIKINELYFKKIFKFKSSEGNFSTWDIDNNHLSRPDMFTVWEHKDGWVIRNSIIPEEFQQQSIGTQFYIKMNEFSVKQTKNPLRPSPERILNNGTPVIELSELGEKLWSSLVKKSHAIKVGNKKYKFIR